MNDDIFAVAAACGREEFLDAGELWYEQLQVQHVLASLRRPVYDDKPVARLRRHLLIRAERGLVKSTVAKRFLYDLCIGQDVGEVELLPEGGHTGRPVILNLGGKGISWERMRGSATQSGDVVAPLLQMANYYLAPELMSFMGHGSDQQAERMDVLNEVLEEGRVTVALIKMAGLDPARVARIMEVFNKLKVRFQPETGIMTYDVKGSFVGCTRPFTERERGMFEDSGFLSRLNVSDWNATDEQVKALWRHLGGWNEQTGEVAEPKISALAADVKAFNRKAWSLSYLKVPYPPNGLLRRVTEVYDRAYGRIEAEFGIPSIKLRSMRDIGDLAQLLTARASARTIARWDPENDGYVIPELRYDEEDAVWVERLAERRMMNLLDDCIAKAQIDERAEQDRALLESFLRAHSVNGQGFRGPQFIRYLTAEVAKPVSQSEAYRRLKRLTQRGWVRQVRVGQYEATVAPLAPLK